MGITSPHIVISIAYVYIIGMIFLLYLLGMYENNRYFNWGPPIVFFTRQVDTKTEYYLIHLLLFTHQLINNWVSAVVYPWILNSVQDPKSTGSGYSRKTSLLIINMFDLFSQIDVMLIVVGFGSQVAFIFTITLANLITSTLINKRYLDSHEKTSETIPLTTGSSFATSERLDTYI